MLMANDNSKNYTMCKELPTYKKNVLRPAHLAVHKEHKHDFEFQVLTGFNRWNRLHK